MNVGYNLVWFYKKTAAEANTICVALNYQDCSIFGNLLGALSQDSKNPKASKLSNNFPLHFFIISLHFVCRLWIIEVPITLNYD